MEEANKPLPPTYFLVYLVAAIVLYFILPISQLLHWPVTLLGILPIAGGIVLNIWADNLFKRENTTVKPFTGSSALILYGPFRVSRHPMYLGMVAILLGEALLLGSLVTFLAPVAMVITLEVLFIPHEERNLEETFGQEYIAYKKRVRRWL